jgi:hypothetical protein
VLGLFWARYIVWLFLPVERALIRSQISPNAITAVSLASCAGAGIAVAFGQLATAAWLYILGGAGNTLLNHFTANALRIPVVIAPTEATSIGNVVVQALALGHIRSLEEAREIVRNSFKMETIVPHAVAWDAAYDRLAEICSA